MYPTPDHPPSAHLPRRQQTSAPVAFPLKIRNGFCEFQGGIEANMHALATTFMRSKGAIATDTQYRFAKMHGGHRLYHEMLAAVVWWSTSWVIAVGDRETGQSDQLAICTRSSLAAHHPRPPWFDFKEYSARNSQNTPL